MFNDHGARNLAPGVPHQVFQKSKLLRSQIDSSSCSLNDALSAIKLEIAHREYGFGRKMTPSEKRADAGRQFAKGEWFWQIVIRARVQTLNSIFYPGSLCQNENRETGFLDP